MPTDACQWFYECPACRPRSSPTASVSGFAAHAAEGHIEPLLAVLTVFAALAGPQLGAGFMAKRAKPGWVKRLYAVLLLDVSAKLIVDILQD